MRIATVGLLLAGVILSPAPVRAQQFSVSSAAGVVVALPDGRLAVLVQSAEGVTVDGLVMGEGVPGAALDIAKGDRVLRIQGVAANALADVERAWDAAPTGAEVTLVLRRGSAPEHAVRFAKPAPGSGRRMAVAGGGAGTGAWVSADGPSNVTEMTIAGAHIRNNSEGLPEVSHRTSHPAAAGVALRVRDVIVAVNGKGIAALAGLELLYGKIEAGAEVELTVLRNGTQMNVTFTKPAQ